MNKDMSKTRSHKAFRLFFPSGGVIVCKSDPVALYAEEKLWDRPGAPPKPMRIPEFYRWLDKHYTKQEVRQLILKMHGSTGAMQLLLFMCMNRPKTNT